ncbi:tRNA pseudouridine synthase-like 1 [Choristoneura fumiferana]|uniref:tRNA pseudouridine synthase-like 1 n=1 Tax=Choristoneura fumiferana TaxID=7141 RepID=UPI003D15955A
MKARYLTFFSYIGSPFRSSEKIWLKEGKNHTDFESIQGRLELALLGLRSLVYPSVILSSRTDGGVHALNASAHFDLEKFGTKIYEPHHITYALNKHFYRTDTPIYVKNCYRVSDTFHARFKALSRTYLYRLAVLKKGVVLPEFTSIAQYIPIEEWKRCHFMRAYDFDIEKFKEGANYFIGVHDFTTFKRFDKLKQYKHNRREIKCIDVRPACAQATSYTAKRDSIWEYWDVEFRGRAFVHNQIRRMMGTLNCVAIGKLPPEEIKVMLQVPSKHSWHNHIQNCPPHGLYLCDVEYNPQDLIYEATDNNTIEGSDSEEE